MGRDNMERIELSRMVGGSRILVEAVRLDHGLHVLVTGGSRTHVGAVTGAGYPEEKTISFGTHKEAAVTGRWAKSLADAIGEPCTVAAGIHYDGADRALIQEVLAACDGLLNELAERLTSGE